jgi:hypothetical protein
MVQEAHVVCSVWFDSNPQGSATYNETLDAMTGCKLIVVCVSNSFVQDDNNRMEFQYAVKTLRKPIIALVVEPFETGPPWTWQHSVVGLLLAGELYIDLTDVSKETVKMAELFAAVTNHVCGRKIAYVAFPIIFF